MKGSQFLTGKTSIYINHAKGSIFSQQVTYSNYHLYIYLELITYRKLGPYPKSSKTLYQSSQHPPVILLMLQKSGLTSWYGESIPLKYRVLKHPRVLNSTVPRRELIGVKLEPFFSSLSPHGGWANHLILTFTIYDWMSSRVWLLFQAGPPKQKPWELVFLPTFIHHKNKPKCR